MKAVTVSPAQVQGKREAVVFGESKDEGASGLTEEALFVEPVENESAADLLVVPMECGLTLGDYEETHPPPVPFGGVCFRGNAGMCRRKAKRPGRLQSKFCAAGTQEAAAKAPLSTCGRE
ncbi:hypothetical protein MTO96_040302 [Rhipicephalus appendiculatus]